MKLLVCLLAFLLAFPTSARSQGYPVYRLLQKYTYDVDRGTAFVVEWKGKTYGVSNWHVCRYGKRTGISNTYEGYEGNVKVLATYPLDDLCLLESPRRSGGLEVGARVKKGSRVYTGGFPGSSDGKLVLRSGWATTRIRSRLNFGSGFCPKGFKKERGACERVMSLQDTTLVGEKGCSGSPVLNSKGKLVGVVNSTNDDTLSYIPVSALVRVIKTYEAKR